LHSQSLSLMLWTLPLPRLLLRWLLRWLMLSRLLYQQQRPAQRLVTTDTAQRQHGDTCCFGQAC
jgi:hypothetical protein